MAARHSARVKLRNVPRAPQGLPELGVGRLSPPAYRRRSCPPVVLEPAASASPAVSKERTPGCEKTFERHGSPADCGGTWTRERLGGEERGWRKGGRAPPPRAAAPSRCRWPLPLRA